MICPDCEHDETDHTGPTGECRNGFDAYAEKPKHFQCKCSGKALKEDRGIILD